MSDETRIPLAAPVGMAAASDMTGEILEFDRSHFVWS